MAEEEEKEVTLNIKENENVEVEKNDKNKNIDGEEEDKESKITADDNAENENEKENLTKEKNNIRFTPKVKLDMKKQRYPYCIVWTPIPCITYFLPSIGHAGICTSRGIIHNFAGPYYVSIDNMAFGNPTKYILLELDSREFDEYDSCIEGGTQDYSEKMYSFCFNNCHSFIARCLNKLKYKGKTNYTMIHVWWMLCIKGKYLNFAKFVQTYIGFFVIVIIFLCFYFLFRN